MGQSYAELLPHSLYSFEVALFVLFTFSAEES